MNGRTIRTVDTRYRLLFLLLACLGLPLVSLQAQDIVYLANGNRSLGKLTGAEGEKVKITVIRNGKPVTFSLRRENVLLAFSEAGRYLIINALDEDPAKAQQEIDAFQKDTSPPPAHDLMLKSAPAGVIPGTIRYESEDIVNYQSVGGAAASVNKRELAAIFYHDGRHRLLVSPAAVVAAINSSRAELVRLSTPAAPPAATPVKKPVAAVNSPKPAPSKPVLTVKKVPEQPVAPKPEVAVAEMPPAPKTATAIVKPSLNEAQYQQYRASALQRVEEFGAYLNIIANKDLDDEEKDKAIDQVVKLFLKEATIEVSSTNKPGVRKYPIREYLNRLKQLPYAATSIDWTEIQYVSELKQAADGDYYGLITGQQTFTGYAENGKDVLYTDVTEKSVQVKLEAYKKAKGGEAELKWAILLGNIGVVVK